MDSDKNEEHRTRQNMFLHSKSYSTTDSMQKDKQRNARRDNVTTKLSAPLQTGALLWNASRIRKSEGMSQLTSEPSGHRSSRNPGSVGKENEDHVLAVRSKSTPRVTKEKDATSEKKISKHKFDDLPNVVKDACSKTCLDHRKVDLDMDILWVITEFLYRKHFTQLTKTSVQQPYASALFTAATKSIIKKTDFVPSFEKQFKTTEFDAQGGYGQIFKSKYKVSRSYQTVAVKKLPHNTPKQKEHNLCEVGYLASCKHPSIVNHIATYNVVHPNEQEELWIVMEYIEGGMMSTVAHCQILYDKQIAWIAREMLLALKYLHEGKNAHRDLKSTNIMMCTNGHVKLVDFGLCADFSDGPRTEMVGTAFFIPPEMIQQKPHSLPVDIWSLGVCLMELLTGHPPYPESNLYCMYKVGTEGLLDLVEPMKAKVNAKDFISKCLQMRPEDRATAAELLEHKWVNQTQMDIGIKHLVKQIFMTKSLDTFAL